MKLIAVCFFLVLAGWPLPAETTQNENTKIEKINPGPKIDPGKNVDPIQIDPITGATPTGPADKKTVSPGTGIQMPKTPTVDIAPLTTEQSSGHSTGSDTSTDATTNAIIGNLIEEEKHNHQNELPSAESLGIGGPQVTDFNVKVPEIQTPSVTQVFVPEPPPSIPRKKKPANAGAGKC